MMGKNRYYVVVSYKVGKELNTEALVWDNDFNEPSDFNLEQFMKCHFGPMPVSAILYDWATFPSNVIASFTQGTFA